MVIVDFSLFCFSAYLRFLLELCNKRRNHL